MRFEVVTAVTLKINIFRSERYIATVYRHFAGISYFHLQRRSVKASTEQWMYGFKCFSIRSPFRGLLNCCFQLALCSEFIYKRTV
jgi:hypothetical protein